MRPRRVLAEVDPAHAVRYRKLSEELVVIQTPQRLRLTFSYRKMTREMTITLPAAGQGLPNF